MASFFTDKSRKTRRFCLSWQDLDGSRHTERFESQAARRAFYEKLVRAREQTRWVKKKYHTTLGVEAVATLEAVEIFIREGLVDVSPSHKLREARRLRFLANLLPPRLQDITAEHLVKLKNTPALSPPYTLQYTRGVLFCVDEICIMFV